MDLKKMIREIPDFPEKGVLFRDVTTLLKDAEGLHEAVDLIQKELDGVEFDAVLGPESRGFIFGMPISYNLKKGFIPVRKKGKLPAEVISREYALEYGTAIIEIHKDAIRPGMKLVVIDDLMATGGTAKALVDMIREAGAEVVKLVFLIELDGLKGRELLQDCDVSSILHY